MEYIDLLSRISLPIKQKLSDEEALKIEETNFSEAIINVIFKFIFFHKKNFLFHFQFTQKNSNFIPVGFENKEEEENEEGIN